MEEILKRLLHFGADAIKTMEQNLYLAFKSAEKGINELIARAEPNSENRTARLQEFTRKLIASLQEYEQHARELSENLQQALNDFNAAGNARLDELTHKLEQLTKKFRSPNNEDN